MQTTSLIAYNEVKPQLGGKRKQVYEVLSQFPNLTNSELAVKLNWPINTVTPRTNELCAMGFVREGEKRLCRVTNKKVIAWEIIRNTLF